MGRKKNPFLEQRPNRGSPVINYKFLNQTKEEQEEEMNQIQKKITQEHCDAVKAMYCELCPKKIRLPFVRDMARHLLFKRLVNRGDLSLKKEDTLYAALDLIEYSLALYQTRGEL